MDKFTFTGIKYKVIQFIVEIEFANYLSKGNDYDPAVEVYFAYLKEKLE